MNRNTETYLSEEEIQRLTGRTYPRWQCRALSLRQWKFEVDADGKPLVLREYHDQRLGAPRREARAPNLKGLATT